MGIGAERRVNAAEGDDFGERRGAVGVGDVAAAGGFHHVAPSPQIMEGIVDRDGAGAVPIGQRHAAFDRLPGDGLAELLVAVPNFCRIEAGGELADVGAGHAAADLRAEQLVEVEGLDRVVRADAVGRGGGSELGRLFGLVGGVAAVTVGGDDDLLVDRDGDDVEDLGHGVLLGSGSGRGTVGFRRPSSPGLPD